MSEEERLRLGLKMLAFKFGNADPDEWDVANLGLNVWVDVDLILGGLDLAPHASEIESEYQPYAV